MSADDRPKKRNWLKTIFKSTLILGVLLIISITIMANIGGNGEGYRTAVEDFLMQTTGYPAQVDKLNEIAFFPNVSFDFEGVTLFESVGSEIPIAQIKRAFVSVGFWDIMFQTGKFKALDVESLQVRKGTLLNNSIHLEHLSTGVNAKGADKMTATGYIGAVPAKFIVDINASGEGRNTSYSFGDVRPFELTIGDVFFKGHARDTVEGVSFEDLDMSFENENVLEGQINVGEVIKAEFSIAEHNSVLLLDLISDEEEGGALEFSGAIKSSCFYEAELSLNSRLNRAAQYLGEILEFPDKEQGAPFVFSDIDFEIQSVCDPDLKPENIKLPFGLENEIEISIKDTP